jgi:Flp pilus assembly protein TadG
MPRSHQRFRLPFGWRSFLQHEDGGVTIFAVIAFSMLLVMIGLVFDVGRVMNVHSETSSYADRAALAAAAELDGRPCAVAYAVAAVTGASNATCPYDRQIPSGRRLTLSGDSIVRVQRMTFYSSYPLAANAVTARWERGAPAPTYTVASATAHRITRYVTVETTTETENFLFFSMLGGSLQGSSVAPRASAGFERRVCNSIPLMICNPDENSPFNAQVGRDINNLRLHYTGRWARGQFALLDVARRSPNALENYIESNDPDTQCYSRRVAVEQSFNDEQSEAILDGLDDRDEDNTDLPVAIVNCNQNSGLLAGNQAIPRVPVETWARLEVIDVEHEEECVEWDRDRRGNRRCTRTIDHYEMDVRVRGLMPANESVAREFSVLVR